MRCVLLSLTVALASASPLSAVEPVSQSQADVPPITAAVGGVPGASQVLLKVQVFEVSQKRLQQLGTDCKDFHRRLAVVLDEKRTSPIALDTLELRVGSQAAIAGLIDRLCQEDSMKCLAEPTLATVDRRPASYFVGGEVPAHANQADIDRKPGHRRFGTELDFTPTLLDDGRLRLELRARVAQLDPDLDMIVDGDRFPGIRAVEVDTGLEMKFGQTAVIAGMVQRRAIPTGDKAEKEAVEHDHVATIFLVTPERVTALAPARQPQPMPTRLK